MTPSTPGEGELIARLRSDAETWAVCRDHEGDPLTSEGLLTEAADTIERLSERLARMEEELTQAVELIHEAIDDVEWGWNNANNHGGMIDDTTWHAGRDFVARLSRQAPAEEP